MSMPIDYEALTDWCKGEERLFPRELSLGRKLVRSYEELERKWVDVDEYLSLFNLRERFYDSYDTLAFDIDGKNGGTIEAREKLDLFKRQFPFEGRLYFSGVGFHYFVDLKKPILGKKNYKSFSTALYKQYSLENIVDRAIVGDVSRMLRAPLSINSKSGLKAIPIDYEETKHKLPQNYEYCKQKTTLYEVEEFDIQEEIVNKSFEKKVVKGKGDWKSVYGMYPPCILMSIKLLKETGELDHNERIHLASFLLNVNDEKTLREALKTANDYSESISNYQIEYIKARHLKSFSCKNISEDICPYYKHQRNCTFYPSINPYVDRVSK
ncbi:MAG: hypothetical protein QXL94_03515 [Candidatus Parvarchaeum sp.]